VTLHGIDRGAGIRYWSKVVSSEANEKLILALPKGRILKEAAPLFARVGIEPEPAFADPGARQLRFTTNHADLDIIRVRSFDVATFVAFGAAHLGIAGADVLMEFDYPEIYAPIDLGIGKCRLAVAEPAEIDKAVKGAMGYAMGPFELLDLVGMDTQLLLCEALHALTHEPRAACPPLVRRMIAAGRLGRKSGRGFHVYRDAKMFGA